MKEYFKKQIENSPIYTKEMLNKREIERFNRAKEYRLKLFKKLYKDISENLLEKIANDDALYVTTKPETGPELNKKLLFAFIERRKYKDFNDEGDELETPEEEIVMT